MCSSLKFFLLSPNVIVIDTLSPLPSLKKWTTKAQALCGSWLQVFFISFRTYLLKIGGNVRDRHKFRNVYRYRYLINKGSTVQNKAKFAEHHFLFSFSAVRPPRYLQQELGIPDLLINFPSRYGYLVKSARLNCIWFQPSSSRIGIVQMKGLTRVVDW
jgi:hypothetical protein